MAAVLAAVLLAVAAAPARATGYRYWSYWLRSANAWTYAQSGPATHTPRDGAVEGWRFAVSEDAAAEAARPRGTADFAAICARTPPAPGRKRVALLLDPGTLADAPGGDRPPAVRTACARIPSAASSADALAAVARPLRYDSAGILCAIAGYPRTGCGDQVAGGGDTDADSAGSGRTNPTSAPPCPDPTDPASGPAGASDTDSASGTASTDRTGPTSDRTNTASGTASTDQTGSISTTSNADRTNSVSGTTGAGGTGPGHGTAGARNTDSATRTAPAGSASGPPCAERISASGGGGGSDGGGPALGLVAGVGVVVALGGAAGWRARRRRG